MNEFDTMKLKGEGVKENRFLMAYNNSPDYIRKIVLVALGLHDELKNDDEIEPKCKIYDFSSFVKKC